MAEFLKINGMEGLLATLRTLPKELQGKPVQAGMRKGGNVIRDDARRRVVRHTGFLSKQIVVRRANAKARRIAGLAKGDEYFTVGVRTGKRVKYANTKRNQRKRRVGKVYEQSGWAYYWRHIEFGTKKMAAKPFLTPAGEASGPKAAQVIIQETRAALGKLLAKRGWK